jgi:hypothetical protein
MYRVRWAVAVLAGGLGLLPGCSTLRDHPWFSRNRAAPIASCPSCPAAVGTPVADGPMMEGGPPILPPPGVQPPGVSVDPSQLNGQPAIINGPLRPVPQPQAQPVPAPPVSRRTPGLIIDRSQE